MNKKQSWELCKCKVFSGYTVGYICRVCKKCVYTEEQAKEIDRLREEGDKKQSWEEEFDSRFPTYSNSYNKIPEGFICNEAESIKQFIAQEIELTKQEIIKKLEEKKRTTGIKGILGTDHRDGVINEGYNQALEEAIKVVKNI